VADRDAGFENTTGPGALNTVQVDCRVGPGTPSSLALPLRVTVSVGSVTEISGPALTVGGLLISMLHQRALNIPAFPE
jgi:hypothetical protein